MSYSNLPKKKIICFNESQLKLMENTFFHLKGSFSSQDIFKFRPNLIV